MMRRAFWRVLWSGLVLGLAGGLAGCASYYYGDINAAKPLTPLIETSYQAADMLLQQAALDPRQQVLVATLVHVDRIKESSRFGRIVAEQISSRMAQRGVRVTELKLSESVQMQREQGPLMLSREISEIGQAHDAQAVVVGTYAVSPKVVYVSVKIVQPVGNTVVAAYDYAMPMDDHLLALLNGR